MQPDSLVFLLIVGMWAVFFVQHWVRRREHLATAHAVDAFTETMRVLDRRPPVETPTRSSYAVPLTARPRATTASAQDRVRVPGSPERLAATPGERAASAPTDPKDGPSVPTRDQSGPTAGVLRVRGTLLAAAALAVPTVVVLAALGTLAWVWVAAPAAVLLLTVAWLRRSATVAARAAARPAAREARPAPAQVATATTRPTPARDAEVAEPAYDVVVEPETAPVQPAARTGGYDPFAVEATVTEPEPEPEPVIEYDYKVLVDEDDIPLTWDPVPVPRPVYAMKARADRPAPAPAATTPAPARPRNHEATAYAGQPKRSAHTA